MKNNKLYFPNMEVSRENHKKDYTVIDNSYLKDPYLSLKAKGLFTLILSFSNDWNFSISGLMKISNNGETSIRSALKELEDSGYYLKTQKRNTKGQFCTEHFFMEKPPPDFR